MSKLLFQLITFCVIELLDTRKKFLCFLLLFFKVLYKKPKDFFVPYATWDQTTHTLHCLFYLNAFTLVLLKFNFKLCAQRCNSVSGIFTVTASNNKIISNFYLKIYVSHPFFLQQPDVCNNYIDLPKETKFAASKI